MNKIGIKLIKERKKQPHIKAFKRLIQIINYSETHQDKKQ